MNLIVLVHLGRTSYGVIRSIRRYYRKKISEDILLVGAAEVKDSIFYSGLLDDAWLIEDICSGAPSAINKLKNLIDSNFPSIQKYTVISGRDDVSRWMEKSMLFKSDIRYVPIFKSNWSFSSLSSKANIREIGQRFGWGTPGQINSSEIMGFDFNDSKSIVCRPAKKGLDAWESVPFRVRHLKSKSDACAFAKEFSGSLNKFVYTEYIPGGDDQLWSVVLSSCQGRLLAVGVGRKIRQFPDGFGEASFAMTCDVNDEHLAMATQFSKALDISGCVQLEFKHYQGDDFLIEVNPRVFSWHDAFRSDQGIGMVALLILSVFNGSGLDSEPVRLQAHRSWQFLTQDVYYHGGKAVTELFTRRPVEAYFESMDIRVFGHHVLEAVVFILRRVFRSA